MPGSTGGGWKRSDLATVTGVAQPTGKPAEDRPQALPSGTATAPALDPTILLRFSPMHHWTEYNIRVHVFTRVLALQIAHFMRREAEQADLSLSVRELLGELAAIGQTVLIRPSTAGRAMERSGSDGDSLVWDSCCS